MPPTKPDTSAFAACLPGEEMPRQRAVEKNYVNLLYNARKGANLRPFRVRRVCFES